MKPLPNQKSVGGGAWIDAGETRQHSFQKCDGTTFPLFRRASVIVLALLFGTALPVSYAWGQGGSSLDSGEVGKEWAMDIGDGQKLRMCYCPVGSFTMGTPADEVKYVEPRERQVEVKLTSHFWLSRTEVTQAQWEAVMGRNPSRFKGAILPVETVSWDDCQEFIRRLNARGGLPAGWKWALPTEAQWEYACRAGEKGPYSGGKLDAVGWYLDNADRKTHEVGMKKPNAWGLHDMHGNVLEWCADWMGEILPGGTNPQGPDACAFGDYRVLRGGSWDRPPQACRAAIRFWARGGDNRTGFRPVLVPSR